MSHIDFIECIFGKRQWISATFNVVPSAGVGAIFDQSIGFRCHIKGSSYIIVAVNGAAFAGGLGMVGAADIVVTVDEVLMSFSEVRIGVIPAVISVVCLPKLGKHHGMKLFLTGERFTGTQAVEMGFAHRAVTTLS